jgi:hypothetical protein
MDQLWRDLKSHISANYHYATIDEHAPAAARWVLSLTPAEALQQAGIFARNFWLKSFLK